MGRATFPLSEEIAEGVEDLGRRVAEAVARGELDLARALTEEAIRLRAGELAGPRRRTFEPGD